MRRSMLRALLAAMTLAGPARAQGPLAIVGPTDAAPSPGEGAEPAAEATAEPTAEITPQLEPEPGPTTTMTDEQRRLSSRGEAAARGGDWAAAARYFRAAVSLGGFNLGWLGLGEALARSGRCAEAATALDAVASAPAVPEAPARFADAMANAQRQALGRTCPGRLVVDCAAPMSRYRIIGGDEYTCGDTVELPAGRYRLRAGPDSMAVTLDAWVVGVETTRVTLRLPRPLPAEAVLGPARIPAPLTSRWSTAGTVVLGVGGAGLLVAAGLHAVTLDAYLEGKDADAALVAGSGSEATAQAAFDRHERWRQAAIGTYIGAGVVALAGAAILLIDAADDGPSGRPGSSLSLGAGGLSGRF